MRECRICGCTDDAACMTDDGPCGWWSIDPPICTACVVGENAAGEPIFRERSESAPIEHVHTILYTDTTSGHCVHCRCAAIVDGAGRTLWEDGSTSVGAFNCDVPGEDMAA